MEIQKISKSTFKKYLAVFLAALFIFNSFGSGIVAPFLGLTEMLSNASEEVLTDGNLTDGNLTDGNIALGDVNADGKINMADVIAIRRFLINEVEYPVAAEAADVNNDGKINMLDVISIRRYLVNATEYPLG